MKARTTPEKQPKQEIIDRLEAYKLNYDYAINAVKEGNFPLAYYYIGQRATESEYVRIRSLISDQIMGGV